MILSDLEYYLVEIGSVGQEPPVRCLVVRLVAETGLEGWGETQVGWHASELDARRNAALPVLAGRNVYDVEDLLRLGALRLAPLRAAVEMACWDLAGRAAGEPLCHLFGGSYRRRVPLSVRVAGQTPRQVARLSRELAEQGFRSQTLASSGRLEQDLETLALVRHMLPDRTELRFDGGASYDFETAWELCSKLEGEPVQFLLDPLKSPDLTQTAALRRQTNVPLAVRRAIRGPSDMIALVRSGAAPCAIVDLRQVGGLVPARKCAAISEAAGLSASLAVGPSLGIGMAAMLQLAAATPAYASCNECAFHHLQDDLLVEPLEIVDGMLSAPQGPGLGVEIDRGKLERYLVAGG